MSDEKKPRLFIRNPDAGEPWAYHGTIPGPDAKDIDRRAFAARLGECVANEVLEADGDSQMRGEHYLTVEFRHAMLTDAEVDALPEA